MPIDVRSKPSALMEVPTEEMTLGKHQFRKHQLEKDLGILMDSIEKFGLLQPIVLCPCEDPRFKYEILAGQRRYLAHQELNATHPDQGWDKIDARVFDEPLSPLEQVLLSVHENASRLDVGQIDWVDACEKLYDYYGTLAAVQEETGLSYAKVSRHVRTGRIRKHYPKVWKAHEEDRTINDIAIALKAVQAAEIVKGEGRADEDEIIEFYKTMAKLSDAEAKKVVDEKTKDPSLTAEQAVEATKKSATIQIGVSLSTVEGNKLKEYASTNSTTEGSAARDLIINGLSEAGFSVE